MLLKMSTLKKGFSGIYGMKVPMNCSTEEKICPATIQVSKQNLNFVPRKDTGIWQL